MQESQIQTKRGRKPTGEAKSSTERGKAADDALIEAGGRIMNKVRLSPKASSALDVLITMSESQRDALEKALLFAETNKDAFVIFTQHRK